MSLSPPTPMARPRATVVVCTYNRADRLAPCLESLAAQTVPPDEFEVIVVDDGSTDSTPEVCGRFLRLPNVRIIRQPNAGLGAARERGWRAGTAPVVAFLDDDAVAPPGWLAAALPRFADLAAAPAVLGGPTRALWEAPRPAWLDDSLAAWLTVWAPFAEYRESLHEPLFVGANMMFQRAALERVGGFCAHLGRKGNSLLSHEESELWERLQAAGLRAAHDPAVWVSHFAPASRLRRSWFRRRIYWEGVSMTRRNRPAGAAQPLRALRIALGALISRPVRQHLLHPRQWGRSLGAQLHVAYCLGSAREWLRASMPAAPMPR